MLLSGLLFALFALTYTYRGDFWRLFFASRMAASCSQPAPAWLSDVASWGKMNQLPGLQIHLRIDDQQVDCAFGTAFDAQGLAVKMTTEVTLPYASLTKIATSALTIIQSLDGQLDMDSSIYDALLLTTEHVANHEAWMSITIRHLLTHQGGFNRKVSGDPMFLPNPPCPYHLERLREIRLDFRAGTNFAYSNLGYCLIGLVLEQAGIVDPTVAFKNLKTAATGSWTRITSAADLDAANTALRLSTREEQLNLEAINWPVHKWTGSLAGTAHQYGTFLKELTSPTKTTLGRAGRDLLTPLPQCDDTRWRTCHGLGFYSHNQLGQERMFWRDGSLPGVTAFAAVTASGNIFVLLANSRDPNWMPAHDELGRIVYKNLAEVELGIHSLQPHVEK